MSVYGKITPVTMRVIGGARQYEMKQSLEAAGHKFGTAWQQFDEGNAFRFYSDGALGCALATLALLPQPFDGSQPWYFDGGNAR